MNGTLGAGLSSGWVHGWMIPFMSKYKLSNSTWFGLGFVMSVGCLTPLHSWDWSKKLNRKNDLGIFTKQYWKYSYKIFSRFAKYVVYLNELDIKFYPPFLPSSQWLQRDIFSSATEKMLVLPSWRALRSISRRFLKIWFDFWI